MVREGISYIGQDSEVLVILSEVEWDGDMDGENTWMAHREVGRV